MEIGFCMSKVNKFGKNILLIQILIIILFGTVEKLFFFEKIQRLNIYNVGILKLMYALNKNIIINIKFDWSTVLMVWVQNEIIFTEKNN